jgi:hypothetical protein
MQPNFNPPTGVPSSLSGEPRSLDEREQQIQADYDWCLHDEEVQRRYTGKVVAVHKQKIWGVGKTHRQATQAALRCPGCPPREALAKVFIEGRPLRMDLG